MAEDPSLEKNLQGQKEFADQNKTQLQGKNKEIVGKFNELFETFIKRRSFKEIVGTPSLETITPAVNSYMERATSLLNYLDEVKNDVESGSGKYTEQDFYAVEDQVLNGVLGSSEAPEIRLLALGLKPAVQSNIGGEFREKMRVRAPNIKVEDIYPLALARGVDDIRTISINYGTSDKPRLFDIAYSPKLVRKVMDEYKDVFSAYGYLDTTEEIIDRAFKDNNNLIRGLLLGFPLRSAMFNDTEFEDLSKLPLNEEQRQYLKKIFESREKYKNVIEEAETTGLYTESEKNEKLKNLWIKSGLDAFLDRVAEKEAANLGIKAEEMRRGWL